MWAPFKMEKTHSVLPEFGEANVKAVVEAQWGYHASMKGSNQRKAKEMVCAPPFSKDNKLGHCSTATLQGLLTAYLSGGSHLSFSTFSDTSTRNPPFHLLNGILPVGAVKVDALVRDGDGKVGLDDYILTL